MISKNPYTEIIIKNYNACDKHKTIELINDAQKSFDKWKTIDISQRAKIIQIIQSNLVPSNCEGKLGKFFQTLSEEAEGPPGLYDINDLARGAKIGQTPQRNKIITCL